MVTKRQILQVVSLAGAAPGFLELRNRSWGLDLQKASWEKAFFPCRGRGGAGVVVLLLKSETWTLVSSLDSHSTSESGFQRFVEHVLVLGGVTSLIGGENVD